MKTIISYLRLSLFLLALSTVLPLQARAACDCSVGCDCAASVASNIMSHIDAEHTRTDEYITQEFEAHKIWMLEVFFDQYILPALMGMTEQLSAVAMHQMLVIGTFIDAKEQLETQRLFQELAINTQKDYYPSAGLCTIGTVFRGSSFTDRRADITSLVLAERSIDRQLQNVNAAAAIGPIDDKRSRIQNWRDTYCDPFDNGRLLNGVCGATATDRRNLDIDFTRVLTTRQTLDINFEDGTATDTEEDVLALAANLFAHEVQFPVSGALLRNPNEKDTLARQGALMKLRSIVAKRSVAESAFNALAGVKSQGTIAPAAAAPPTVQYLRSLLEELGFSAAEAQDILGDNPSHYAQMDILTRRIFQRPEFFVDLYDKPANTPRKALALRAISLMQQRNIFEKTLQIEQIISLILELEINKAETATENLMAGAK